MSFKNQPYFFVLIAFLFFGLFYFIENNNDSFLLNDFKVYYSASETLMNGGQPYGVAYGLGSGFYKYSPVTLFLFSPYTLFSFETAKTVHFIMIAFLSIGVFLLCWNLCNRYFENNLKKRIGFLSLLLLISAVHLTREMHLGNINMIMAFIFLMAIHFSLEKKIYWSAFFFVILILLKPYFLILILPLVISKNFKLISLIFVYAIALTLLPILFIGFDENTLLLKNWLLVMKGHTDGMISEHTFSHIFYSYSGIKLASYWQLIFIGCIGFTYCICRYREFFGRLIYDEKKKLVDFFILLAIIPNLVITDSQHFLFSVPLIALILGHLKQKMSWQLITIFVVLLFFYGANSNDLLGNPLSDKFDAYSTIGLANLGLILFLILLERKRNKVNLFS